MRYACSLLRTISKGYLLLCAAGGIGGGRRGKARGMQRAGILTAARYHVGSNPKRAFPAGYHRCSRRHCRLHCRQYRLHSDQARWPDCRCRDLNHYKWSPGDSIRKCYHQRRIGWFARHSDGYQTSIKDTGNGDCEAFQELKRRLLSVPVPAHYSYEADVETRVETDASDTVTSGVLSQRRAREDWCLWRFCQKP